MAAWQFGSRQPWTRDLPILSPLAVVELPDAYLVTVAGVADDWLVSFARDDGVDASGWAENMVRLYNLRLEAILAQATRDVDPSSRGAT